MAKLTTLQKTAFNDFKEIMNSQGDYEFLFDRENGISAMAVFTGSMKNHVRIVLVYCGENDTFKKKIGFIECARRIEESVGVVMPADSSNLSECLDWFLVANFAHWNKWETM